MRLETLIRAEKVQPVTTNAFLQPATRQPPGTRHVVTMLDHLHPTKLIFKMMVPTDNMLPNLDDTKWHHQWLR